MLDGLNPQTRRRVLERLDEEDMLAWRLACAKLRPADPRCSACGAPADPGRGRSVGRPERAALLRVPDADQPEVPHRFRCASRFRAVLCRLASSDGATTAAGAGAAPLDRAGARVEGGAGERGQRLELEKDNDARVIPGLVARR